MNERELFLEHLESLQRALDQMQQWTKQTKKNLLFSMGQASTKQGEEKSSDTR